MMAQRISLKAERSGHLSPEEFVSLFETYYPRIMAYAISRMRDRDIAQDIAAEVLTRAYTHWGTLRDKAHVESWLFSIAHNLVVSYLRSQAKTCRWEMSASQPSFASPEDGALLSDDLKRLRQALHLLPSRYQEIISLRFNAGLSHRQIADILGITPGNVRVMLCRGLQRLRDIMARFDLKDEAR